MKLKKLFIPLTALALLASCSTPNQDEEPKGQDEETYAELDDFEKIQYSAGGVIENKLESFEQYKNTEAHVKVKTANEFLDAIHNAKNTYTTVLNADGTLTQTLNEASTIHIIEIENDLDLGYELIKDYATQKEYSFVKNWSEGIKDDSFGFYSYNPLAESGISQIEIARLNNVLIFSKNGSKLTHGGFKVNSCNNIAIRNLKFDEIWQWEDSKSDSPTSTIGDYDVWGWAYFKIGFSDNIWIDHCEFGKSYDGQIDISNPTYNTPSTYSSAPLNGSGFENVHISFCNFKAGSDDQNGYIYKMMSEIEADYQLWKANPDGYQETNDTCRYYRNLREIGASFEDILYGVAIPQKKGFLLGDTGNSAGGQLLTEDITFQAGKTYYKVGSYEPSNGRAKKGGALVAGTDYQVGDVIADRKYTVYNVYLGKDVEISDYFEIITPGPDYYNNQNLKVSFNSCIFKNIEDRLPNLRAGIAYFYNSIIDSSQYHEYEKRSTLQNCKSLIGSKATTYANGNPRYKLALVSQAGITVIGGSIYADTVIYKGFNELMKNNNIIFEGQYANLDNSGYKFVNVVYSKDSVLLKGSTGSTNPFISVCKTNHISPSYFSFHNETDELPFTITQAVTDLTTDDGLDMYFTAYPAGTREGINYYLTKY